MSLSRGWSKRWSRRETRRPAAVGACGGGRLKLAAQYIERAQPAVCQGGVTKACASEREIRGSKNTRYQVHGARYVNYNVINIITIVTSLKHKTRLGKRAVKRFHGGCAAPPGLFPGALKSAQNMTSPKREKAVARKV